ncbi:hypothetical protein B1NLA3E_12840 [Bacillus sp. 1NLA3E]|nr:hypothetical protein B1NLA3E_12840 [Bacillus sp. 1NLA3E]
MNTWEYFDDLNKAIEAERIKHEKKPLKGKEKVKQSKEIQVSKCFINFEKKNRAKHRRIKRAARASLLQVTGIEEYK